MVPTVPKGPTWSTGGASARRDVTVMAGVGCTGTPPSCAQSRRLPFRVGFLDKGLRSTVPGPYVPLSYANDIS